MLENSAAAGGRERQLLACAIVWALSVTRELRAALVAGGAVEALMAVLETANGHQVAELPMRDKLQARGRARHERGGRGR